MHTPVVLAHVHSHPSKGLLQNPSLFHLSLNVGTLPTLREKWTSYDIGVFLVISWHVLKLHLPPLWWGVTSAKEGTLNKLESAQHFICLRKQTGLGKTSLRTCRRQIYVVDLSVENILFWPFKISNPHLTNQIPWRLKLNVHRIFLPLALSARRTKSPPSHRSVSHLCGRFYVTVGVDCNMNLSRPGADLRGIDDIPHHFLLSPVSFLLN